MKINETYKEMINEFTVSPSITFGQVLKYLSKNNYKMDGDSLTVNLISRESDGVYIDDVMVKYVSEFMGLDGDARYEYIRELFKYRNIVKVKIPIDVDKEDERLVRLVAKNNEVFLNFAKELAKFTYEHSKKVAESDNND